MGADEFIYFCPLLFWRTCGEGRGSPVLPRYSEVLLCKARSNKGLENIEVAILVRP